MVELRSSVLVLLLAVLGDHQGHGEHAVVNLGVAGASRLAIWRSRAFVSVPASVIEVNWPLATRVRHVPAGVRRCSGLQHVVDLKTDTFGRLWVLDAGTSACPPKLVVYDILFYRLTEILRHKFQIGPLLTNFVVDAGTARSLSIAYVSGSNEILVYSVYQDRSWSVPLQIPGPITGLTLHKQGQRTALLVETDHVTVHQLFTSSLLESKPRVELVGQLLGPNSAGLLSDAKGGVYYVMARDYAALKWDSALPLEAESHDVLLQSRELLRNVTQLTQDSNKNVWALVSIERGSWCVKLTNAH